MRSVGQTGDPSCQKSGAYIVSSLAMLLGFGLFLTGIVLPSWRQEIGYTYGLWVRCDGDHCKIIFPGFSDFMIVVQSGIIISMLLLTVSAMCLLLECCMKSAHSATKHIARTGTVVAITAALGEVLAALTLGYYGYKTVMAIERYPALTTGFAMTGLGIIVSLMGNILRAMGTPSTWGDGACCLAPAHKSNGQILYAMGSESPSAGSGYYSSAGCPSGTCRMDSGDKRVRLSSCFNQTNKGNSYSSVPSTANSSLDRGYQHYEEINFDDMPPPPLELLNPFPPVKPSPRIHQEFMMVPQARQQVYAMPQMDDKPSHYVGQPVRFVDSKQQSRQQHLRQPCHLGDGQASGSPQIVPRQTKQQRSIIRSGQRDLPEPKTFTCTMAVQHRSQITRPAGRYQTMPSK